MDKIKEFYNKNNHTIGIIYIFIILVIFFNYIGFTNNNFTLFIYSYLIILLLYGLIFKLKLIEKFIVDKITIILILSIILIIYKQVDLGITNKDILLMVGGIIAFWYGYKKYERDKELEILNIYGKKYDEIKLLENKEKQFIKILNLCEEEFYLFKQGYISKHLWERIEFKIEKNIGLIIEYISKSHGEEQKQYIGIFADDNIFSSKKGFGNYIIKKLNLFKNKYDLIGRNIIKKGIYSDKKIIDSGNNLKEICELLIKEIQKMLKIQKEHFNN